MSLFVAGLGFDDETLVDAAKLGAQANLTDADLRSWYDAHQQEFTQEEQVRARHILVMVNDQRDDAAARQRIEEAKRRLEGRPGTQQFVRWIAKTFYAPVGNGVKTDALEALIAEHKPKFVYLIPTFGNPSGATLSLERRKRVLELAVNHQTLIVEDDPYGELYFGEPPPPSILSLCAQQPGAREWVAHCGSMSKVLSPGLRVGWMIAQPELLAKATMCKQFSDAHTSTFAQATAAQYLKSGRMPATLHHVRQVYAERAYAMGAALQRELGDAIEFTQPQGGLFFWARLTGRGGKLRDANEFAKRAIEQGVAFVPGAPFFARDPDVATLRLSFATADVKKIEEGIGRLAKAL